MPVRSFTARDVTLTERQRLEKPLLLLIWLGTASFSLNEGNWLYLLSSTLGVAVNWLAVQQKKEIYISRNLVNGGVLLASVLIVIEHLTTPQPLLVTIGHFMVLIQLCKLFERKRTRDYVQLLALNMLLMVTTALQSTAVWYAVLLVGYLALACYVAMVFTLKRGLDAAAETTLRGEAGPLSIRQVAWNVVRDWPARPLRRTVWLLLLPSLALAVVAFVFIPRAGDEVFGALGSGMSSGGLDPSVRLGGRKEIYLSDLQVMHVSVRQDPAAGSVLPESARYLRRHVLDSYEQNTWRNQWGQDRYRLAPFQPPALPGNLRDQRVWHTVQLLPLARTDVVVPQTTIQFTPPEGVSVRVSPDLEYEFAGGEVARGESLTYQTLSLNRPLDKAARQWLWGWLGEPLAPAQPARNVRLSGPAEQRITALIQQLCGDLLAERAKAPPETRPDFNALIAERLSRSLQDRCSYSLDLSESDPTREAVVDFLFHLRKGHCEYFASALAVMCCLADVPARVATGYVLNEFDPETQQFTVRQRDAHAWVEVFLPRQGWARFDPTPASDRVEAMTDSWWSPFRDWFQDVQMDWYAYVVSYDRDRQRDVHNALQTSGHDLLGGLTGWLKSLKESFIKLLTTGAVDRLLGQFLIGLNGLTLLGVGLWALHRLRRRSAQPTSPAWRRRLDELDHLLKLLARKGLQREPAMTLQEYLRTAAKRFALPAKPLGALLAVQYRWRWGGKAPDEKQQELCRKCIRILLRYLEERPVHKRS